MGNNEEGVLHSGPNAPRNILIPTPLLAVKKLYIISIHAGTSHYMFTDCDHKIYGLGSNALGQLGCENATGKTCKEVQLVGLDFSKRYKISCGNCHTAFLQYNVEIPSMMKLRNFVENVNFADVIFEE